MHCNATLCVPVMQPHPELELQKQDSASSRCPIILTTTTVYGKSSWPIPLKSYVQLRNQIKALDTKRKGEWTGMTGELLHEMHAGLCPTILDSYVAYEPHWFCPVHNYLKTPAFVSTSSRPFRARMSLAGGLNGASGFLLNRRANTFCDCCGCGSAACVG